MIDIVFPSGNEDAFIEVARRLGMRGLVFVYKEKSSFYTKKGDISITNALLCEPHHVRNVQNMGALAVCFGTREAIERGADICFGFEHSDLKDRTHYRESGLNDVLCRLASEKKVTLAFNFSAILSASGQSRAILLGRISQNIMLCTKYKTPMRIASFATDPYQMRAASELASLFFALGMNEQLLKESFE